MASRVSLRGRASGVAAGLTLVHWRQMTRSRVCACAMQAWQKVCPQPMSTRGRRSWRSEWEQLLLQAGQRRHSIPLNLNYINCKINQSRPLPPSLSSHIKYTNTLPVSNTPTYTQQLNISSLSCIPNPTKGGQWIKDGHMRMLGPNLRSEGVLMCRFVFYVEQFLSNVILIFLKEGMSDRLKGMAGSQSLSDRMLENELLHFITFVKRAPLSIQRQLLPYCFELRKDFPNDNRVKAFHQATFGDTETRPEPTNNSEGLIKNLFRILQLKYLPLAFNKTIEKVEADRSKPQQRTKQQIFGKGMTFERAEMLHPEYDTYYKMSKHERGHHLPQHYPRNRFKEFYTEPRYLVRIEEMAHFHSNEKLKGDILFLHYQGNIITGSKAYAVARDRVIEHWEMTSSNYYPIPTLNIPAEIDPNEKKDEEEKKEKQKEVKNEPDPAAKFALNHVFTGHLEKITCISFSQDQLYLISGSADRTVKLWCLRMRTCLGTYRGHQRTIWDVHFSPSGYYFLSGSADGCMILWKTDEPHAQRVYNHKADVLKVSIAKDPSFVISAGEDGTIKIWKTLEAELFRELRLGRPVVNMNLGLSGSLLVAVESDGKISIFDLMKGETINSFYFYEDRKGKDGVEVSKVRVHDVCLSEDERELSCVSSKYVVIYSMERLEMKVNNNIYTFYENAADSGKVTRLPPKEIIYMGIQTNLTYCSYQHKNVLVVAGSSRP